ncbi:GNAT family N-acetyltransferase [Streptomyces bambusae]|uniref:GNAT family N-acetyltransferase n=1 Tax=Streptomyces bambusae TaxID=1550616 RepID=UPI001CFCEE2C|nr:GNAT family N-acetyltransferase [Streptomyces bambusae]MCB5166193.1 GNAT family N-acetyltransferase [Streptomyces bambusae]
MSAADSATPSAAPTPPPAPPVDVRPVGEPEFKDWLAASSIGFLSPPAVTDEEAAYRLKSTDLTRVQGAFDPDTGRCVATFRSFAQQVTVPGGAAVTATAVSRVTVLPTHRRRGLLGRMMAADLGAARRRGEVLATLVAAEYPIYGRYGFGPATSLTEWEIDVARTGLDPRRTGRPACGGRIDVVDAERIRAAGPVVHERLRARLPGVIDRPAHWWDRSTGLDPDPGRPWTEPFSVLYRSPAGEPEGYAVYTADDRWTDAKTPSNTLTVKDLIAATPAAERALWHFLCSVDWVRSVRTGYRAPDALVPDLFPNPRAAAVRTQADWLWVRVLDVVRALEARTYEAPGALVLEVEDQGGLAGGRFRLVAGADGRAECRPAGSEPAELRLGVAELGALYLGDVSAVRLAALGRLTEEVPGAVARAESLFRTAVRPWCPDLF